MCGKSTGDPAELTGVKLKSQQLQGIWMKLKFDLSFAEKYVQLGNDSAFFLNTMFSIISKLFRHILFRPLVSSLGVGILRSCKVITQDLKKKNCLLLWLFSNLCFFYCETLTHGPADKSQTNTLSPFSVTIGDFYCHRKRCLLELSMTEAGTMNHPMPFFFPFSFLSPPLLSPHYKLNQCGSDIQSFFGLLLLLVNNPS